MTLDLRGKSQIKEKTMSATKFHYEPRVYRNDYTNFTMNQGIQNTRKIAERMKLTQQQYEMTKPILGYGVHQVVV